VLVRISGGSKNWIASNVVWISGGVVLIKVRNKSTTGSQQTRGPCFLARAFLFANFPFCRTRSEDSAERTGRKSRTNVLRQESEGEVTQEETAGFDRSNRVYSEHALSLSKGLSRSPAPH
jgi:hypothetical protein